MLSRGNNDFQASFCLAVKSLKEIPRKILDCPGTNAIGLARQIFSDESVSAFLIGASRLPVFAKDLQVGTFQGDLQAIALIKQLKYFYNQPVAAVLQELVALLLRDCEDKETSSAWDDIINRIAENGLGTTPVCRMLQEAGLPECYKKNAEDLEKADPHAIYPTSIYRSCEGEVLAKADASVLECRMNVTLTATVKIVNNVLNPEQPELRNVYQPLGRCIAIVDEKVEKLFGEAIRSYFRAHNIELLQLVFPANEVDKDISTVQDILVALKKLQVARNEPVLVVGGGVISDVAGFATALYNRNTPYIMLCTSIVAAIDAGPSPRTGCDGYGFKNLYGTYHPPVLTLVDRSFFRSLHRGWIRHGIAEIVKMGVIKDRELFSLVEQHSPFLVSTKFGTDMDGFQGDRESFGKTCDLIIGKALEDYVRSEYSNLWETHQCRAHAYAHTWSPGYELPSGMLHGHAVATEMGLGAYLSFCDGCLGREELERILKLLSDLELSLWHPIMEDTDKLFKTQEKVTAKRGGNLVAPLPDGLGNCRYVNSMPYELLCRRLQEYKKICQQYPREGLGIEVHCKDVGLDDPATVGEVNKKLPGEALSHDVWIDLVQREGIKGLPEGDPFKKVEDAPYPLTADECNGFSVSCTNAPDKTC